MIPIDFSLKIDEDIVLKLLEEKDSETLFALVDENREHLREFLGWLDYNQSSSDSLTFIKREKEKLARFDSLTLAIYFSNTFVGLISLYNIDTANHTACMGYWIAQKYQSKGIIVKSARGVIQYALEKLNFHRIEIRCAIHNVRSQKVIENLGFAKEGLLKSSIFHYGKYFDSYLYGLIGLIK